MEVSKVLFQRLAEAIAIFYFFTWFIWPLVLVMSFAMLIKNNGDSRIAMVVATISLTIILSGITAPLFRLLVERGGFYMDF